MSELPERKVLKEILPKLKLKAMRSEEQFKQILNIIASKTTETKQEIQQSVEKAKTTEEKTSGLLFLAIQNAFETTTTVLIINAHNVIQDLKMYIETLEKYSSELDKAFWGAIEERIEEERKKQDELRKKEPSYRA